MPVLRIVVAGPAEWTRSIIDACQNTKLSVAAIAVAAADLVQQVEDAGAVGVIAPAEEGWMNTLAGLARTRRNVSVFVSGYVNRESRDRLEDNNVILLPRDPARAVRGMVMALERIAPASYHHRDEGSPVVVNGTSTVAVLRPVIALFYCVKGGVGKTTTAANVAATMGMWCRELQKTGQDLRVAAVDNNPDGNLGKYFGYPLFGDRKRIRSVMAFRDMDPESNLKAVLACLDYHAPSNVHFVGAPGTMPEKCSYSPEVLRTCLTLLARHFHFVFVDMGVHMDDDSAVVAAEHASDVALVCDTDPMTASLLLDHRNEIVRFFGGIGKLKLVFNHRENDADPQDARKTAALMGVPLAAELPYCPEMRKAAKKLLPVVCYDPKGKYATEVTRLSQKIAGTHAVESVRTTGLWSKVFRKGG